MRRRHPRTLGRTQPGTFPLDRRQHRRTRRQAQAVHGRLRGGDQAPRVRLREVEGKRLCGWDSPGLVPSETRFCCVFGEFAERGFTDEWFAEMIVKYHGDIPAETVSYDSAPVEVRSADGACPEMGEDTDGDGVERPYRPPPHCLKTLPAPTRHERWRNRSARLPSNDLPAPAYRGFEITSTVNQPPS